MSNEWIFRQIRDIGFVVIGAFVLAFSVNYFVIPNMLSEGGVIGMTVILVYLFDWSPGIINFALNAGLIAFGYRYFTKRALTYTILSVVFVSVFLFVTEGWSSPIEDDPLLAALFAGVFIGLGLGLMFRSGGTAGGTTVIAQVLHQVWGYSVSGVVLFIDILVIVGSAFVIGQERAMYTLVAVYIGAKVIDMVIEGPNARSAVMIISNQPEEILKDITERLARGVTVLEGRGGYSKTNKEVLYIVVNKREIVRLRNIVEKVDEDAYITVHSVQEVFGRGYKGHTR